MPPPPEVPTVQLRHDIYPAIDPNPHYTAQTYKSKIVLITGASRGIGSETALMYARSGASVILLSRKQETLSEVKAEIVKDLRGKEGVIVDTIMGDVVDVGQVKSAVEGIIGKYGRLDICIANAGKTNKWDKPMVENDPEDWWNIMEVNLRGVFNVAHFALPHIDKAHGYFLITASNAGYRRIPGASAYVISKLAVGRLNEYAHLEHPNVKSIAFHPGVIGTELGNVNEEVLKPMMLDTVQLAGATLLQLASGKYDWLSGRFFSATWDLEELERVWKDDILEEDAFVARLAMPKACI
ncbi:NAD-P-binding protein [Sistotremastrum niveocremeum HHB9708]|uniref:NAD-P-binding protein n=1 Tax=Sistotremastrum niveocremeum HHB9708 TaxID=1314777 RepID=A0A164MP10_9AGAM|nr:NAD-P-binding protein [Sistotremastrum niveocremeum HHB9708]